MNRVCLSGRFDGRPRITYSPSGLAFAEARLRVPRARAACAASGPAVPDDLIPCLATGALAVALYTWGEPGVQVEVEGRLLAALADGERAEPTQPGPLAVHADYARVLEDPLGCLSPGGARESASILLVLPKVPFRLSPEEGQKAA